MNIIFISTEIWSEYNPEGIVAKKILNGLIASGHSVHVITTKAFEYDNTKIIPNFIPEIIEKGLKNLIGLEKISFVYKAINYLKSIDLNYYNLIITRSEPISLHLIQTIDFDTPIKKIAMFSDVGYLNPYYGKFHFFKKKVSYHLEKKLGFSCDLITHTNQFVINQYVEKGFVNKKFCTFPNPLEMTAGVSNRALNTETNNSTAISLAYTGSLYGKRNPRTLFQFLSSQKIDFQLYLIGAVRNVYYEKGRFGAIGNKLKNKEMTALMALISEYKLDDKVKILPFMSKSELANFINNQVDILVNIDAQADVNLFLSSKVVDYLQYNKPILNISSPGATVEFLKTVGVSQYIDHQKVTDLTLNDIVNSTDFIPNLELINQYSTQTLISALLTHQNIKKS